MEITLDRVTHIGGDMYGDGEYVVEFRKTNSFLAPLSADVMTPSGKVYEATFGLGDKANVKLATVVINQVKLRERFPVTKGERA